MNFLFLFMINPILVLLSKSKLKDRLSRIYETPPRRHTKHARQHTKPAQRCTKFNVITHYTLHRQLYLCHHALYTRQRQLSNWNYLMYYF